jgi:hypothetical protein
MQPSPLKPPDLYPEIEPYARGMLDVGPGDEIVRATDRFAL